MNINPIACEPALDLIPTPQGELTLKVMADRFSVNSNGDVFGGWVALHMDQAGELAARKTAGVSRVVAVSIGAMNFLRPVKTGDIVAFYSQAMSVGSSSITVDVEAWIETESLMNKLTESSLVFVAIDSSGRAKTVNNTLKY
ncbi:acyl-CoA thioesterase [Candidatus Sororendozoicomonas aggregata]|uniref:acyl-CoA thioesterase n=1 Tax=Candidatus Sororendozoicomonas aggregata TaxID=3073239 RepID=UPI002ED2D194